MKYRHFVSAPPAAAPTAAYHTPQGQPGGAPVFGSGDGHGSRPPSVTPGQGSEPLRDGHRVADGRQSFRMPPVVQFLANVDPGLARYLTSVALQTHLRGGDGRAVCDEVYAMSMRLGYTAVLNMQEVFATGMPSYPGQRVTTTFVMVDLAAL